MTGELLSVRDLRITFPGTPKPVTAVHSLSFTMRRGETLACVGESGSGKTVTGLSLMGLLRNATISGTALFDGRDVLPLSPHQREAEGGPRMAMVFQDPLTALNPVMTIGDQLREALRVGRNLSRRAADARALDLLERVRIPEPRHRLNEYPHRLSGGMRQRVVIALALAREPSLLIADEPTTALDVTIQAQILQLLMQLKEDLDMAILLITHDLAVVAETADRVLVMRDGEKLEERDVIPFFDGPLHPYSRALLAARPRDSGSRRTGRRLVDPGSLIALAEER
ncbi:MAG: ABC transporter ATP-binding protein [Microvirga sp.]